MSLPPSVAEFLQQLAVSQRAPAYVQLGADGRVEAAGGDLDRYGLDPSSPRPLSERLPFLSGLLPVTEALHVPRLRWGQSPATDLHAFPDGEAVWLVFLDASAGSVERRRRQQLANERALREEQTELELRALEQALGGLDLVVCVACGEGRYRRLGHAPAWFSALAPGSDEPFLLASCSPFLASFQEEAEAFWAEGSEATRLRSGPWTQQSPEGELTLEAIAVGGGRPLLVLKRLGVEFEQQRARLQATREVQLLHERLQQEVAQRDILIHCIVHDLMGPLTSMRGCLDLLREDLDDESRAELLEVGLLAASGQERMIRDILAAFQAETEQLQRFERSAAKAPDALACARAVAEILRPAFQQAEVELRVESALDAAPVWGESSRLERVISNLVENALRHAPRDSRVTIQVTDQEDGLHVRVEDEGPGVRPEQRRRLFQKFGRGKQGGKAGLGLYFCRITVERWGGEIGCEPRASGGTRFWFRLPQAK